MLFYTFNKMLNELEKKRTGLVDRPHILVYNSDLERWGLLDIGNNNDNIQYFEDPSNQLVCLAMPSNTQVMSSDLNVDEFETFMLSHMTHAIGNPLKHTIKNVFEYYSEYINHESRGDKSKQDSSTNATTAEPTTTAKDGSVNHALTAALESSSEPSSKKPIGGANSN